MKDLKKYLRKISVCDNYFIANIGSAVLSGGCGVGFCDNWVGEVDFLVL